MQAAQIDNMTRQQQIDAYLGGRQQAVSEVGAANPNESIAALTQAFGGQ